MNPAMIAQLILAAIQALGPEILAIIQAIQGGQTPTPAQMSQLVAYSSAHADLSSGLNTVVTAHYSQVA